MHKVIRISVRVWHEVKLDEKVFTFKTLNIAEKFARDNEISAIRKCYADEFGQQFLAYTINI